ncbi:MAG: nucleotidyltransferase family protein [Candidatus Dormiibacterota bacterium]
MSARSAGVVLAAGSSSRMGEPKQLLSFHGRPLLEHVVRAACGSRLDEVVVVLGAHLAPIRAGVEWGRSRVVSNPEHAGGLSTSIRAGISALGPDAERAMIILGDQPEVSAELFDRLLDAQAGSGLPAAALSIDGLLHPPVVLARELWPDILALAGDIGCRRIIRARPELVAPVAASAPGGHPIDIDTPEDWRRMGYGASASPADS